MVRCTREEAVQKVLRVSLPPTSQLSTIDLGMEQLLCFARCAITLVADREGLPTVPLQKAHHALAKADDDHGGSLPHVACFGGVGRKARPGQAPEGVARALRFLHTPDKKLSPAPKRLRRNPQIDVYGVHMTAHVPASTQAC